VYDRIKSEGLDLGSFTDNVVTLSKAKIAGAVIHSSGLVYLSGTSGGSLPMNDDADRIIHGIDGARMAADTRIQRLHWVLSCGGEADLNDVLYPIKVMRMVVSPGGGTSKSAPAVTNGFSLRWHSIFGGPKSSIAVNRVDPGACSGIHARSAIGGFDAHSPSRLG
jgi:hypothetical protein